MVQFASSRERQEPFGYTCRAEITPFLFPCCDVVKSRPGACPAVLSGEDGVTGTLLPSSGTRGPRAARSPCGPWASTESELTGGGPESERRPEPG